jgi:maltose O-acetyltransferase
MSTTPGSIENLADLVIDKLYSTARCNGPSDRLQLGEGVICNDALFNTRCGTITIGKGTHFGHGVRLLTGAHDVTHPDFPLDDKDRSIEVGERCWLASYCIILGPVKIGDGCVIGAGSVVTKDCEAGWFYGGNPAKKIRKV